MTDYDHPKNELNGQGIYAAWAILLTVIGILLIAGV